MSERRVYLGKQPTVFLTGNVGAVVPGQEFDVPDEDLAAFDARTDISIPPSRRGVKKNSGDGEAVTPAPSDGNQ